MTEPTVAMEVANWAMFTVNVIKDIGLAAIFLGVARFLWVR